MAVITAAANTLACDLFNELLIDEYAQVYGIKCRGDKNQNADPCKLAKLGAYLWVVQNDTDCTANITMTQALAVDNFTKKLPTHDTCTRTFTITNDTVITQVNDLSCVTETPDISINEI